MPTQIARVILSTLRPAVAMSETVSLAFALPGLMWDDRCEAYNLDARTVGYYHACIAMDREAAYMRAVMKTGRYRCE